MNGEKKVLLREVAGLFLCRHLFSHPVSNEIEV
jgi:hypothetical protein